MVIINVIGYMAAKVAFIQHFIVFVERGVVLALRKHFYAVLAFPRNLFCRKIFRTGKQNVWVLCRTNLGVFSLPPLSVPVASKKGL